MVEFVVAGKFGHLRIIHILITQEQYLEENYVMTVILLLLVFFFITLDFTLALRSVLVNKMQEGNITCNII